MKQSKFIAQIRKGEYGPRAADVVVVGADGVIDQDLTRQAWAYARRHPTADMRKWAPSPHKVMSLDAFEAAGYRVNPYTGQEMTPRARTRWEGISDELQAVAAWAVQTSAYRGTEPDLRDLLRDPSRAAHKELLEDFGDLQPSERLRWQESLTTEPEAVAPMPTPAPMPPSQHYVPPPPVVPEPLARLLLSMFSSSELRRFVRWRYPSLYPSLPGESVSQSQLASDVVGLLRRGGHLEGRLWLTLMEERRRRSAEIAGVRGYYVRGDL